MKIEKTYINIPGKGLTEMPLNRKRVAAYCRVSSKMEAQMTSLDIQELAYRTKILENPAWELVDIYVDEGISGTSTKNRTEFLRMLEDSRAGKIDLILTKSISRFSRNTVDCLTYIQELQSYKTEIVFEKENIRTGESFSDMVLSILAAFAQEESRSLSENVKWGIRKRYEAGQDRWIPIYGYTSNENGSYQIVEEEAAIVREVFDSYRKGQSMQWIADELTKRGVPTPAGNNKWEASAVQKLIRNEKYVGDILLQKRYTVDHIEHKEVRNDGTVPAYYIQNHHTPIVSRQVYDQVQKVRAMKPWGKKQVNRQYPFAEFPVCPYCGNVLLQKRSPIQACESALFCEGSEGSCGGFILKSKFLTASLLEAYNSIDEALILQQCEIQNRKIAEEAQRMLTYKKEMPCFDTVEYYWLDELVDRLELGRHTCMPAVMRVLKRKNGKIIDDRTLTVYWKCGLKSTVYTGVQKDKDCPQVMVSLYQNYLDKAAAKRTSMA
jgi:DNA invertase Pin-like site-specific DNA recombinase